VLDDHLKALVQDHHPLAHDPVPAAAERRAPMPLQQTGQS
jgi:hypothetical protein